MASEKIKITKAEWDVRPKTDSIVIEGYVIVDSFDDEVTAQVAEPQGDDEQKLYIEVKVDQSGGPKKPQPMQFYLREFPAGNKSWKEVQVRIGDETDSMPITKLCWA